MASERGELGFNGKGRALKGISKRTAAGRGVLGQREFAVKGQRQRRGGPIGDGEACAAVRDGCGRAREAQFGVFQRDRGRGERGHRLEPGKSRPTLGNPRAGQIQRELLEHHLCRDAHARCELDAGRTDRTVWVEVEDRPQRCREQGAKRWQGLELLQVRHEGTAALVHAAGERRLQAFDAKIEARPAGSLCVGAKQAGEALGLVDLEFTVHDGRPADIECGDLCLHDLDWL
ncbi:MAG: hypothetical protein FJ252_09340 [Phycisphaerae bacterium]|nr:hypothetical protein [Phycisphaerae bacterium]